MPKFAIKGVSDIVLLNKGVIWFIEVKNPAPNKTYQTPDQKLFEDNVKLNGGKYLVARSIDDLITMGL